MNKELQKQFEEEYQPIEPCPFAMKGCTPMAILYVSSLPIRREVLSLLDQLNRNPRLIDQIAEDMQAIHEFAHQHVFLN